MASDTKKILQRIKALEAEKAKLLPLRKEEIFSVLQNAGGITLDNRLLAGLAIYASNPNNVDSNFLRELLELGKKVIPSRKDRGSVASTNADTSVQSNASKKGAAYG